MSWWAYSWWAYSWWASKIPWFRSCQAIVPTLWPAIWRTRVKGPFLNTLKIRGSDGRLIHGERFAILWIIFLLCSCLLIFKSCFGSSENPKRLGSSCSRGHLVQIILILTDVWCMIWQVARRHHVKSNMLTVEPQFAWANTFFLLVRFM